MTMLRFDGRKDLERRRKAEQRQPVYSIPTPTPGVTMGPTYAGPEFRKKSTIFAIRMDEPFEVETLEGLHTGKAGDYLAIGIHGELYPIDAAVFEESYEAVAQ